jgi:glutathione-regulated potassium-efflux system ancillary protein KefG
MVREIKNIPGITLNDLYEHYPDFDIDVKREQTLLLGHDIIIFQHPFYWYSTPAIIKQWFDLVLEHGWAYGKNGHQLKGKYVCNAISCGGSEQAYQNGGRNRLTIRQFLAPVEQTVLLCQMKYLPPFVVYGTHTLEMNNIETHAKSYAKMLIAITEETINLTAWHAGDTLDAQTLNSQL